MNTPQSMALGWGALLVAGIGSFIYAKREIDARRRTQESRGVRPTEKKDWYDRLGEDRSTSTKTPSALAGRAAVPPSGGQPEAPDLSSRSSQERKS